MGTNWTYSAEVAIIGMNKTGKSALKKEFNLQQFTETYDATHQIKKFRYPSFVDDLGFSIKLTLVDTIGLVEEEIIENDPNNEAKNLAVKRNKESLKKIPKCDAYLFTFSLGFDAIEQNQLGRQKCIKRCKESFRMALSYGKEVKFKKNRPVVLIGTKLDGQRVISLQEAHNLVTKHKLYFQETSAKQHINVKSVIQQIASDNSSWCQLI